MLLGAVVSARQRAFDVVITGGTIVDGTGLPRYAGDVGIRNGFIAAIGDLGDAAAAQRIDARGLFVAPGFINIHSHASPDALPTAVNMLLQGVTTEIINADGAGPTGVAQQRRQLQDAGLAVNVGGYIGFNSIWQSVVGNGDRRPEPPEIDRMRAMIVTGLAEGAWGVSAGLDYKPGYFAKTEEVIRVVDAARSARTNFTNHDRITPESNFSSKAGIAETLAIGEKAGLVPVVTHMKVQGREQGTADGVLASMADATRRGHYTAADAYPYLAGQSGLGSLIIPGWAQEGGREAMLARFADPNTRARIIKESEEAIAARFGGPEGVYLPRTQQELTAVMKEMHAGAGETIIRILEQGADPGAILRFGAEDDLIKILKNPATAMACDCGATLQTRVHPRFYGSFPRVLGRYVREQRIMSWEEAIRKSSYLPANTIGMVDRGAIAVGMAADIAVFDPNTIIDRATYENPAEPSTGMTFVLVNGVVVLNEGRPTQAMNGRALARGANMPSRAVSDGDRALTVRGTIGDRRIAVSLTQRRGERRATGSLTLEGMQPVRDFGILQTAAGWASVTGAGVAVIADLHDPANPGGATIVVLADGTVVAQGKLPANSVLIK